MWILNIFATLCPCCAVVLNKVSGTKTSMFEGGLSIVKSCSCFLFRNFLDDWNMQLK